MSFIPQQRKITAWSYSRFMDYKKCPFLAKLKHVDRMKEPDNPAMSNGSRVHELAQHFTEGKLDELPKELRNFEQNFVELKSTDGVRCEQEWAFTKEWKPTGWFSGDAWVRIKVDAKCVDGDTLYIIDHKTGRVNEDHEEQRKLYGLGGLIMHKEASLVIAQHWYLDHGVTRESRFERKHQELLFAYWEDKTTAMLADTRFAPNPGNHCRWCHFRKANGGPCQF